MIQLDYTFERRIELEKRDSLLKGEELKIIKLACKKLQKNKDIPTIASELEEDEARISAICTVAQKYAPDYDAKKILAELESKKTEND